MYEQLEKFSRENNLVLDKIVDGQVVDAFPSRDNQSFFALMVCPYSSPAYSSEKLLQLVQSFSANPPSGDFFSDPSLLVSSSSGLGGRVPLILFFLLLVPESSLFSMLKLVTNPTSSTVLILLTLSVTRFLFHNRSVTGLQAGLLFWSPFIRARFASQASPDQSVTINRQAPLLEDHLQQLLEGILSATIASPGDIQGVV